MKNVERDDIATLIKVRSCRSVLLTVSTSSDLPLASIVEASRDAVDRRCLVLPQIIDDEVFDDEDLLYENAKIIQTYLGPTWHTRSVQMPEEQATVLLDGKLLLHAPLERGKGFAVEDDQPNWLRVFDILWESAEEALFVDRDLTGGLLYQAVPKGNIVVPVAGWWDDVFKRLLSNPAEIYNLTPRKFEELVAELLLREGHEVLLTPPQNDGGADIFAWAKTPVGRHLYVVECKRWKPTNPVGVGIVRALYGVANQKNATSSILATTSSFTRGAKKFQKEAAVEYKLDLKNYDAVLNWIRNVAGGDKSS